MQCPNHTSGHNAPKIPTAQVNLLSNLFLAVVRVLRKMSLGVEIGLRSNQAAANPAQAPGEKLLGYNAICAIVPSFGTLEALHKAYIFT